MVLNQDLLGGENVRFLNSVCRSTSLLESSMLLNIQQPFSKLENTILIPASPDKVTLMALHFRLVTLGLNVILHLITKSLTLLINMVSKLSHKPLTINKSFFFNNSACILTSACCALVLSLLFLEANRWQTLTFFYNPRRKTNANVFLNRVC